MEGSHEAARHAASLPILLCHGLGNHILFIVCTIRSGSSFESSIEEARSC